MFLLGYDIGSSSIKASLLEIETGTVLASATSPEREMDIITKKPGWAEQHPQLWWENLKIVTNRIQSSCKFDPADLQAIGISYQMHGLVIVDKNKNVLRPAIIWCDSRAVTIGQNAAHEIGSETCLKHFLNLPGNFTASKLKWVMQNEPDIFGKTYKAMLPGDYIAMKLTGNINTTPSGLSEGIMWDFPNQQLASLILDHYHIPPDMIPKIVPTFSVQGQLSKTAANELNLKPGTKVSYRAGDQPNNALSLNVLQPGEIAANAGTSGVVYGIHDQSTYDPQSRVNTFVHVNHTNENPRYGVLLCLNGTGILNSWLRRNFCPDDITYDQMNDLAAQAPPACEGLFILPYGNGAERTLSDKNIFASFHNLNFNIHDRRHILRAAQEGIAFALNYGLDIMRDMNMEINTLRAGLANMFLSPLFASAFAAVTGSCVELYNTDGSQGAARGAGIGADIYKDFNQAFSGLRSVKTIEPDPKLTAIYQDAYQKWLDILQTKLNSDVSAKSRKRP